MGLWTAPITAGKLVLFILLLIVPLLLIIACYDNCESTGEVSLEVSAYRHPAIGEFDGSIRSYNIIDFLFSLSLSLLSLFLPPPLPCSLPLYYRSTMIATPI